MFVANPDVIKQRLNQRATNPEATQQYGKFIITDQHFQRIISYYEEPVDENDVFKVDTSSDTRSDDQLHLLYGGLDIWLPAKSTN